eukprot:gene1272-1602_t
MSTQLTVPSSGGTPSTTIAGSSSPGYQHYGLKIGFPPGNSMRYKNIRFPDYNITVREAINFITEKQSIKKPELYEFLILDLKKKYQLVKVFDGEQVCSLIVDVTRPLNDLKDLISCKFKLRPSGDYRLFNASVEVPLNDDENCTIRTLNIDTSLPFILKDINDPLSTVPIDTLHLEDEDDSEDESRLWGSNLSLDIPAKSVVAIKEGFLKKQNRKKSWNVRYFKLTDKYLYYYKTPQSSKASGIINYREHIIRLASGSSAKDARIELIPKKSFHLVNGSGGGGGGANISSASTSGHTHPGSFVLKFDSESELMSWMQPPFILDTNIITPSNSGPTTPSATPPNSKFKPKTVFGTPIERVVLPGQDIPPIISQTIEYIEKKAMDTVGIFRLSGSVVTIESWKNKYDKGEKIDLLTQENDPHAVAGLLKLYLRELPDPLLTYSKYKYFIASQTIEDFPTRIKSIKHLIKSLPPVNYAVLSHLLQFLGKVATHSAVNKMQIHNLSTVFGPNLIKDNQQGSGEDFQTLVEDTPIINALTLSLIRDYQYIFGDKEIPEQKILAKTLYDYTAVEADDLSFTKGVIIRVTQQALDGWWNGEYQGKTGKFPTSYVELIPQVNSPASLLRTKSNSNLSKKKKFLMEMDSIRTKTIENEKNIEQLQETKAKIVSDIATLRLEKQQILSDPFTVKLLQMVNQCKQKQDVSIIPKNIDMLMTRFEEYKMSHEDLANIKTQLHDEYDQFNNNPKIKSKLESKDKEQLQLKFDSLSQRIDESQRYRQKSISSKHSIIHSNNNNNKKRKRITTLDGDDQQQNSIIPFNCANQVYWLIRSPSRRQLFLEKLEKQFHLLSFDLTNLSNVLSVLDYSNSNNNEVDQKIFKILIEKFGGIIKLNPDVFLQSILQNESISWELLKMYFLDDSVPCENLLTFAVNSRFIQLVHYAVLERKIEITIQNILDSVSNGSLEGTKFLLGEMYKDQSLEKCMSYNDVTFILQRIYYSASIPLFEWFTKTINRPIPAVTCDVLFQTLNSGHLEFAKYIYEKYKSTDLKLFELHGKELVTLALINTKRSDSGEFIDSYTETLEWVAKTFGVNKLSRPHIIQRIHQENRIQTLSIFLKYSTDPIDEVLEELYSFSLEMAEFLYENYETKMNQYGNLLKNITICLLGKYNKEVQHPIHLKLKNHIYYVLYQIAQTNDIIKVKQFFSERNVLENINQMENEKDKEEILREIKRMSSSIRSIMMLDYLVELGIVRYTPPQPTSLPGTFPSISNINIFFESMNQRSIGSYRQHKLSILTKFQCKTLGDFKNLLEEYTIDEIKQTLVIPFSNKTDKISNDITMLLLENHEQVLTSVRTIDMLVRINNFDLIKRIKEVYPNSISPETIVNRRTVILSAELIQFVKEMEPTFFDCLSANADPQVENNHTRQMRDWFTMAIKTSCSSQLLDYLKCLNTFIGPVGFSQHIIENSISLCGGREEIPLFLLDNIPEQKKNSFNLETSLSYAIRFNCLEIVKRISQMIPQTLSCDINSTPISLALTSKSITISQYLLENRNESYSPPNLISYLKPK